MRSGFLLCLKMRTTSTFKIIDKKSLLEQFKYDLMSLPTLYGKLIKLDEFLKQVQKGHHQNFMGTGQLVLNNRLIENSDKWVYDGFCSVADYKLTLEELDEIIDDLYVFWVSVTDLLF